MDQTTNLLKLTTELQELLNKKMVLENLINGHTNHYYKESIIHIEISTDDFKFNRELPTTFKPDFRTFIDYLRMEAQILTENIDSVLEKIQKSNK